MEFQSAELRSRIGRASLLGLLALAFLSLGCMSDEQRAASLSESARTYLEDGDIAAALIEAQAALRANPDSPEANFVMAQTLALDGQIGGAIELYRNALRLAPRFTDAALQLASILRAEEPEEAADLLASVQGREPENPLLHIALSELAVAKGNLRAAQLAATHAVELSPENPAFHKKLGDIGLLQAKTMLARRGEVPKAMIAGPLGSLDRALVLEIDPPWRTELSRARLLMLSPDREAEAAEGFRRAVRSARASGMPSDEKRATLEALSFARETRDADLRRWALEQRVEADPANILAWEDLAKTYPRSEARDQIFEELLSARPDDFEAHQAYARHLVLTRRLEPALAHFAEQAALGNEPARMRAARMNLLGRIGRDEEAAREMAELVRLHPNHPRTRLEIAHRKLRKGRVDEAAEEMRRLQRESPSKEGFEAVADLEYRLGNLSAARAAIEQSIELTSRYDIQAERLLANVAFDQRDFETARRTLEEMHFRGALEPAEMLHFATSLYETQHSDRGKAVLRKLLKQHRGPPEAAIELARREAHNPESQAEVRLALQAAFSRHTDLRALAMLTNLELQQGKNKSALQRLDRFLMRRPDSNAARVVRASTRYANGDVDGAQQDLQQVLERDPRDRGALTALSDLAIQQEAPELAIRALEATPGALGDFQHPATLGHLYHASGQPDRAIAAYESALKHGRSPEVQNNLAFLLIERADANTGGSPNRREDLERALGLALLAIEVDALNPALRDTVGLASLRLGDLNRALIEFMAATHLASPPSAQYFYHLGLAHRDSGNRLEARKAFDRALELQPDYSRAEQARDGLKSAAASAP